MDDATAKELGLRALAVGFRWAPGCVATDGDATARLTEAHGTEWWGVVGHVWSCLHLAGAWPDFRDPAAMGVLLGQFIDAWHPVRVRNGANDEQWRLYKRALSLAARWVGGDATVGDELIAALVAALQAAKEVGDE